MGVRALRERQPGLNEAITQATRFARRRGASAVLVVHGDLPQLRRHELGDMVRALARHRGVVIAPDRDREGTNALALRPPYGFSYRFGLNSFRRHSAEARRTRRRARVLYSRGLAHDVDVPEHLSAA
jgi:2-phospho-L-lactate/phosphoenolpyruvate guanylyltransferase